MSRKITQPVNQVRLTNVAVVRMNTHGKRFEVACYRNKILNYRQKIETDLSEVLQTDRVFNNVSKGLFASSKDLLKAFNSTDQEVICRLILDKGQIQVSDMERNATLENTAKEIANYIATKCVHPVSNRPYTVNQIRDAMKKAEISVQPTSARSVKQQFLDCVKVIQQKKILEIQRAKMELAIVLPSFENGDDELRVEREELQESIIALLQEEAKAIIEEIVNLQRILFLIDPSAYRVVDGIAKEFPGVKLEILRQTVTQEGDVDVSLELERNTMLQQQSSRNDQGNISQLQTLQEHDSNGALHSDFANMSMGNNQYNMNNDNYDDQDDEDDDDEYEAALAVSSRKKNKKAAKKSKKQKRREKEESSMRQERIEAEKARQEERNIRLGLNNSSTVGDSEMNSACTPCTNINDRGLNDASNDGGRKSCNTCGGSFTVKGYRAHFRSDWHRYNQKLKMKGVAPIDENEFLLIDSDAFFTDGMK